jgi:sulfide:quinone oxidoreductase
MSGTRTVILGGGFGGISAANSLRRLLAAEHEIVVVDRTPRFHVGAGKTWIMLGERTYDQISQSRAALLVPGVRLIDADVQRIELADRTVTTGSGRLDWDFLVIALGADLNLTKVPGLADAAHTFYTVEGAVRLKDALASCSGGDVALLIPRVPFKCPPAPYEAAMLLHHALESRGLGDRTRVSIYTVEGAPMTTAGPEMGQFVREELSRRGIGFFPNRNTVRVDGVARRVVFEDGSEARYDLLIAVPPHESPEVVRNAGLTNQSGWVAVEPETLRVKQPPGADAVYAVGDVTTVPLPGRYKPDVALSLPKAGVFAEAQGRVVAQQIAGRILGRAPNEVFDGKGFCYLEVGEGRAVRAEGSFFDLPHPVMQKQAPDEAQLRDKVAWVDGLLAPLS